MAEIVGLSLLQTRSRDFLERALSTARWRRRDSDSDGYWPRSQRSRAKLLPVFFFSFLLAYNLCHQHFVVVIVSEGKERERERKEEWGRAVATEIELQWSVRFVISATAPQVIRLPSPLSIIIPMQRTVTDGGRHSAAARFINFASASLQIPTVRVG